MKAIKKPLAGEQGAERKAIYYHYSPLRTDCQPASWLIRSIFIENLVSKPYTRKNSLMVDFWLVFADSLEQGVDHVWN